MIPQRVTLALLLIAVGSAACEPDGPVEELGPPDMVVVAGDGQADTVQVQLPDVIDVVAGHRKNGTVAVRTLMGPSFMLSGEDTLVQNLTPITGAIVNFVVLDPECGRPFAGSALTDAQGHAKERWILGKKAKACVMEARLVNQVTGAALVVDSIHATVLPGAPTQLQLRAALDADKGEPYAGFVLNDTVPLDSLVGSIRDAHGNAVAPAGLQWVLVDSAATNPASWPWANGPAVFATNGLWRLYVRSAAAFNFTWVRIGSDSSATTPPAVPPGTAP